MVYLKETDSIAAPSNQAIVKITNVTHAVAQVIYAFRYIPTQIKCSYVSKEQVVEYFSRKNLVIENLDAIVKDLLLHGVLTKSTSSKGEKYALIWELQDADDSIS